MRFWRGGVVVPLAVDFTLLGWAEEDCVTGGGGGWWRGHCVVSCGLEGKGGRELGVVLQP